MKFMKAMKKFIVLICAAVMLMSFPVVISHADDDIEVYLNGNWIYFEDQQPVIVDGRTLVPLRAVFEAMGAEVRWFSGWNGIDIYCADDMKINLVINQYSMYKTNGHGDSEKISIDVAPQIINDRTMIPLRAVSEAMGAEINWDGEWRIIEIYYSEKDIDKNKQAYSERTKFYSMYPDVLNFEHYIGTEYSSDSNSNTYKYDSSNYYGSLNNLIDGYVEDMQSNGFVLEEDYSDDDDNRIVILSGSNWNVKVAERFEEDEIWVSIFQDLGGSRSSSDKMTTPKPTATPKPTPEPTQAPAFMYLKDLGWDITDKDYDMNSVSSVTGNAVQFEVYLSDKKNEWLDKGDEAGITAEFYLNGDFSRLTGVMNGSTTKLSLKFYCDGEYVKGYTGVRSDTNLDLDVSDCHTLRIEAYGNVGYYGSPTIKIKDATLWYE